MEVAQETVVGTPIPDTSPPEEQTPLPSPAVGPAPDTTPPEEQPEESENDEQTENGEES